jgi:hypothetical protein
VNGDLLRFDQGPYSGNMLVQDWGNAEEGANMEGLPGKQPHQLTSTSFLSLSSLTFAEYP